MTLRHALVTASIFFLWSNHASADDFSLCKKARKAKTPSEQIQLYTECIETGELSKRHSNEALFERGQVYYSQEKYNEAIADYQAVLKIDPKDNTVWHNLGVAFYMNEDPDAAVEALGQSLSMNPYYVPSYTMLGSVHSREERYDLAAESYTKALEINPKYIPALYNRANAYRYDEQYDIAILDFNAVIKEGEYLDLAHLGRALSYKGLEQYGKALADFDVSIEKNDKSGRAYAYRCTLRIVHLEQSPEALSDCEKAASLAPNDSMVFFERGKSHEKLDMIEQATQDYERALEIFPGFQLVKDRLESLSN